MDTRFKLNCSKIFALQFHALKKNPSQPPYYYIIIISLILSTALHHLAILWEFFLTNICPTLHNLFSPAPISLLRVVLHPAISTFLCASSHLSFSTVYLPFPLCFHTLSSSTFSPFLLITSKTSLLILLSPTGPLSVSTLSPSFG